MTVSTGALHPPHNISKKHQVLQQHDFRFPPNKNKSITSVKKDNSSVAVGFDRVQLPISSHGIKECFGEGPIYSPWETPQKKVGQKMTGENREDMFHEANGIASLGGNFDGFTDRSDKQILLKSDAKRCYLPVDSRVHLIDLLEGLASLDDYGIFSDPVEDSLCIKYSNINRKPMTFSMMRKKIDSEGYTSWRSFVDDFESICYNAMEYYQKHSKFWKAANSILCQGRAYLDQNAEKADEIFGCFTRTQTLNGDEDCEDSNKGDGGLGNEMIQEMECHNSRCNAYFTGNALLGKASFQPDVMKVDQLTGTDAINPLPTNGSASNVSLFTSCITSLGRIQELEQKRSKMHNLSGLPLEADDSVVDIIDCARDDIRFDFPEQATECSSSFGGTDIDDGYDSGRKETFDAAEVESQLLNANKAATPASIKRRKNPLSLEWKAYRCGIEWRCRWLELRIKELQSQASKYDHLLEGIRAKKSANNQHFAKASTARVAPLICDSQRQRILHRKPKKKVENTRDFSTYMSQHPLHSLYEKNKRMEADEIPIDDTSNNMASEQIQQCLAVRGELKSNRTDESHFNNQLLWAETTDGENSAELIFWEIENLQSRIRKMKNQLNKLAFRKPGKIYTKFISQTLLPVESSKARGQNPVFPSSGQPKIQMHVGGGSKLQSGSSLSRRRVSDYNINNVLMPGNTVATYVEPARHRFIETPKWRLVEKCTILNQMGREDSSEEATDEEVYTKRHTDMELKEKHRREFPCPGKKVAGSERSIGKGIPKTGVQMLGAAEKDRCSTSVPKNILHGNFFPLDLSVPKGKRKGKKSRPSSICASLAELKNTAVPSNWKLEEQAIPSNGKNSSSAKQQT